jgi:quercetin dioxygenase-like cupin family protein
MDGRAMKRVDPSQWALPQIDAYASHGLAGAQIAEGDGEARAWWLVFEAGGAVGRHEAGFGQLFFVVAGSGWVEGGDARRVEVSAGDAVFFERGEQHAKGSAHGMTALMLQVRELSPRSAPGSDPQR